MDHCLERNIANINYLIPIMFYDAIRRIHMCYVASKSVLGITSSEQILAKYNNHYY